MFFVLVDVFGFNLRLFVDTKVIKFLFNLKHVIMVIEFVLIFWKFITLELQAQGLASDYKLLNLWMII